MPSRTMSQMRGFGAPRPPDISDLLDRKYTNLEMQTAAQTMLARANAGLANASAAEVPRNALADRGLTRANTGLARANTDLTRFGMRPVSPDVLRAFGFLSGQETDLGPAQSPLDDAAPFTPATSRLSFGRGLQPPAGTSRPFFRFGLDY